MTTVSHPIAIVADYDNQTYVASQFQQLAYEYKLTDFSSNGVECKNYTFEPDELLLFSDEDYSQYHGSEDSDEELGGHSQLGWVKTENDPVLVRVSYAPRAKNLSISGAGTNITDVRKVIKDISDSCEKAILDSDNVGVNFWVFGPGGPSVNTRSLKVPALEEVAPNYTQDVLEELHSSMNRMDNPAAGRILVWHGPPGTGKTYALRAMMRALKSEFEFNYIVDPDTFFNAEPAYMLQVLMGGSRYVDPEKKRLFIFEDTGEMLQADSSQRVGQGLSRLLNFTDGLIGQGLELYGLITTNEEIGTLHPAVTRAGRCLSEIFFGPLPAKQANEWLRLNGERENTVSEETTVSELYAILGGYRQESETTTNKPAISAGYV